MTIRYDPTTTMHQTPSGRYITFAEHEAVIQELLESIGDYFKQVEAGEVTAADAENCVKV